MKNQVIVTIGREYGSAGHFIAGHLAQKLGFTLYDKRFFVECHDQIGYSAEIMEKYDEKPVNVLISRRVRNHTNSIESHVQNKVNEFILSKAASGESFVVVGRCADQVLRHNPNTIKVFITGHMDEKLERIMDIYKLSKEKAADKIKSHDKKRRYYHNTYSDMKWGDSRGYDICINSSIIGIDATVDILANYVEKFREAESKNI